MTEPTGSRNYWPSFWVGAIIVSLAWGLLFPWEWSYVDEPGFALVNAEALAHNGVWGLIQSAINTTQSLADVGRFRPAYAGFVHSYLVLGPQLAHAGRIFMVLVSLAALLLQVQRNQGSNVRTAPMYAWVVVLFFANYTLFDGLYWAALSELTGVFFVSLGLWVRNSYLKGLFFLVAALGKEPFVWLVIALGVGEFLSKKRLAGALVFLAGLVNLILIGFYARTGSYTDGASSGMIDSLLMGMPKLTTALMPWFIILVLGGLLLRVRWRPNLEAMVFLIGGLGYLASVSLWGAEGYLMGPIAFLLTTSLVAGIDGTAPLFTGHSWFKISFVSVCLMLALVTFGWSASKAIQRNQLVVGIRDWSLKNVTGSTVLAVNQIEAANRVPQINEMADPDWNGHVIEYGKGPADYLAIINDFGLPAVPSNCTPVHTWAKGSIVPLACN